MSYFDSAYIAKFYLDEPEGEAVRRLAESLGQVRCAQIGHVEVAAVFHRPAAAGLLRSADALHLTCAEEHGFREIYTNDRHMSSAARHFRLRARAAAAS